MSSLLSIRNLTAGYGKEPVIKDICLEVKGGDFIGIIGPNGCGKTTLLRFLSKALPVKPGKVSFELKDISQMSQKEFCRKVAFVGQDNLINFPFTVFDIVMMGRIPHLKRLQQETKKDLEAANKALIMTDTLHLKEKFINQLSSGERQRVIVAKALAQEPSLIFLDEPTSHLDIGHQIQILDLLRRLNRENGLTITMVLHELNLASEYCNRIILLNEGRIFREGSPAEVLTYQNIEVVYKTVVVVKENPINKKPLVILVAGKS